MSETSASRCHASRPGNEELMRTQSLRADSCTSDAKHAHAQAQRLDPSDAEFFRSQTTELVQELVGDGVEEHAQRERSATAG